MEKGKRKTHLRLVKSSNTTRDVDRIEEEIMAELDKLEELEFQILSGPPDWTVAIDKRAPLEVKLRILAAVKSYAAGCKSTDHLLRKNREDWARRFQDES